MLITINYKQSIPIFDWHFEYLGTVHFNTRLFVSMIHEYLGKMRILQQILNWRKCSLQMFWVKTTFMTECKFIYFKMSTLLRSTAGVPVWRGLVRGRGRWWRCWRWWRGRRCRGCVRRSTARCPRCACTQTHCTVLYCTVYCTVHTCTPTPPRWAGPGRRTESALSRPAAWQCSDNIWK